MNQDEAIKDFNLTIEGLYDEALLICKKP